MNHFYFRIPGWFNFQDVYSQAVREAKDGAHFVEVGAWKGKSAAYMAVEIANSGKRIGFDCVDHFLGSDEPQHHADADVKAGRLFEAFTINIAPVAHLVRVIKLTSTDAAASYRPASLDLVFLDGAHDLDNVRADIAAWRPKIKPGGVMAGDDWNWPGVKAAVREAFASPEILGEAKGVHWRVRV
jgi:predicted O-methyltransferase YrrM